MAAFRNGGTMGKSELEKLQKELCTLTQKHEDVINKYMDMLQKLNPLDVKSKFITCRECGSKLNTKYMKSHVVTGCRLKCPVCGSKTALYSATYNTRISAAKNRYDESRKKQLDLQEKINRLTQEMKNEKSEKSQAEGVREVRERLEIVYSEQKTPDFIEIHGEIGGDILCYRVYKDGSIYEK